MLGNVWLKKQWNSRAALSPDQGRGQWFYNTKIFPGRADVHVLCTLELASAILCRHPKRNPNSSWHFLSTANGSVFWNELLFCCRQRLAELPRRFAWYPGSEKRWAAFKAKFRDAAELGTPVDGGEQSAGFLPWVFKSGLTPDEVRTARASTCSKW